MTEQQEQLIEALNGAAQGINAAVEQQTITPAQIYRRLNTLIKQMEATFH